MFPFPCFPEIIFLSVICALAFSPHIHSHLAPQAFVFRYYSRALIVNSCAFLGCAVKMLHKRIFRLVLQHRWIFYTNRKTTAVLVCVCAISCFMLLATLMKIPDQFVVKIIQKGFALPFEVHETAIAGGDHGGKLNCI